MRYEFVAVTILLLTGQSAAGHQNTQPILQGVAGLAAPVPLPSAFSITPPKKCEELDGVVKFAAVISAAGMPEALETLGSSDARLVNFATELVKSQRFKPGTTYGANTAVAVELTVGLHTCAQREKRPIDGDFYRFTLRAHPPIALAVAASQTARDTVSTPHTEAAIAEQVGGRISAPIPTFITDPKIPVSRKLPKRGLCLLAVMIDADGVPQNIHVVRSLDPELDSNVIEAVKNWRFKPALRDGSARVAVEGTVVAMFEYLEKEPIAFATFTLETPENVEAAHARHDMKLPVLEPVNADEVIARYMPQSRISGRCLVSLVVDANGVPQNVHVIKGLDSGLDVDTVAMVEHLRFKPVMKDATTPVSVGIIVPVRYRETVGKPTWGDLFYNISGLAILFFL
jgi:TonB family protein